MDKGSSHRGEAAKKRLRQADSCIILVHTPVHASWLNQVEIYFSIIQRKVLTPNDFADKAVLEAQAKSHGHTAAEEAGAILASALTRLEAQSDEAGEPTAHEQEGVP